MDSQQAWNSLEITKFIASLATPIAVALVGFWISIRHEDHDRRIDKAKEDTLDGKHTPTCRDETGLPSSHGIQGRQPPDDLYCVDRQRPAVSATSRDCNPGSRDQGSLSDTARTDTEGASDPRGPRALFPHKILEAEPCTGPVELRLRRTRRDAGPVRSRRLDLWLTISYLLAQRHRSTTTSTGPHTAEAVFAVPPARVPVG